MIVANLWMIGPRSADRLVLHLDHAVPQPAPGPHPRPRALAAGARPPRPARRRPELARALALAAVGVRPPPARDEVAGGPHRAGRSRHHGHRSTVHRALP